MTDELEKPETGVHADSDWKTAQVVAELLAKAMQDLQEAVMGDGKTISAKYIMVEINKLKDAGEHQLDEVAKAVIRIDKLADEVAEITQRLNRAADVFKTLQKTIKHLDDRIWVIERTSDGEGTSASDSGRDKQAS